MDAQSVDRRYALLTRDLEEVIGDPAAIKAVMAERPLVVYWGTAPTGKPHLGYFVPVFKLADFLAAGCRVRVLFANVHAYLDNMKTSWELVEHRCRWYELAIKAMLAHIGVAIERLEFVRGTDFQRAPAYALDVQRMAAVVTAKAAQKAACEVVKMCDDPRMSNLVYPMMQALDEHHMGVDAQFGGRDQRKIFAFARDSLPKLGYPKRFHLVNPLVPGLGEGGKMSASEPSSKIDLDDDEATIRAKVFAAHSLDGVIEGNGLLAVLRHILWRWLDRTGGPLVVPRPTERGGAQTFAAYKDVEAAFARGPVPGGLSSEDLKAAVADLLCAFLAPLRTVLLDHADLVGLAYPTEPFP